MSQSIRRLTLMLGVPLLLAAGAGAYYFSGLSYATTDNAYVQQHKVGVSAEVGGRIVEVAVSENQRVEAGELLFRIDPEPYQLALQEAQAELANARARLEQLETDLQTSSVDIERAEEDVRFYEKELQRHLALAKTGVSTDAQLRAAEHALSAARSELATARADAAKARAALSTGSADNTVNPQVLAAQVKVARAQLNLARTEVRAPVGGIVSQSDRLQPGQLMMQGLSAVTIVDTGESWVEANFKETELNDIRIGQAVDIRVDAFPDHKLQGAVASIGAGTGSEFSILPAQNANANWVKVTQRVPVRIAINDARPELIAGLSVHVRVDLNH
ncbi:HlyD family secretion protein [Pseudomaricurvus sp. HS19]|uniref:HlyD family secretion protein n=1 Tax=Pseudomaricurvus sp. HS19 TaxID=2692626 RepID=UPI001F448708|nr:HlyD family secretion protein [Pseudomaricurvus sp. HS19]